MVNKKRNKKLNKKEHFTNSRSNFGLSQIMISCTLVIFLVCVLLFIVNKD